MAVLAWITRETADGGLRSPEHKEAPMTSKLPLAALVIATLRAACAGAAATESSDELLRVDDHRLHIEIRSGSRPVTIVLEAGGAADATAWATVPEQIAERTGATVVTYDRAGLGASELGRPDLSPGDEVDQLAAALKRLRVPEDTVVVGHSYGGLLALDFASRHPQRLLGLVLVDPMNPRFIAATGGFVKSTAPKIDEPKTNREHVVVRMTRTLDALADRVRASEPKLSLPMVVITAGVPFWGNEATDAAWRRSHEEMAAAAANRRLAIAEGSKHGIPATRPEVIVDAVAAILAGGGQP